ncbi:MAG TPA: ThuA domain-containing protein, partial [Candidatus Sulfotelmatobacter sp.]|nr:ThuA domain-containing protein [Candidatus Sulfotelmatobacter sp.]
FVVGGGGLLGVHGTTVAFTQWPGAVEDWPEFGFLIGARGANHKDSDEHLWLKLDDAANPITQVFGGQGFDYRDEFFRPQGTYSRSRVRVLLSIDTAKTDPNKGQPRGNCFREDNDYAVAWIRNYGRGRVFYSTIAHNPYVFWDAKMLQFYLAALQFALGDLPTPTTPSAKLTPAMRAQEKLGWRLALEARAFPNLSFFETIDQAARFGLPYIGGSSSQMVGKDLAKGFGPELSDAELTTIRLRLESAGLRLLTYDIRELPNDEAACRRLFEFGRKLGIETFIAAPQSEALDRLEKLCDEYAINLAVRNADGKTASPYWKPEAVLEACKNRSRRMGACGDVGAWLRSGIDPLRAVRTLKDRVLAVQLHDLDAAASRGQEVPWGTGRGQSAKLLAEIEQLGLKPTFGLDYSGPAGDLGLKLTQCVEFFNQTSEQLGTKAK